MEACGRAGRWNNALGLLAEVRDRGLRPDTFTLNAVMDALGRCEDPLSPRCPRETGGCSTGVERGCGCVGLE